MAFAALPTKPRLDVSIRVGQTDTTFPRGECLHSFDGMCSLDRCSFVAANTAPRAAPNGSGGCFPLVTLFTAIGELGVSVNIVAGKKDAIS